MGLFRNLETRHLMCGDIRTCIAIEPQFWKVADQQAAARGIAWHDLANIWLEFKPADMGRARWLRVAILEMATVDKAAV